MRQGENGEGSTTPDGSRVAAGAGAFGPNAWLVEDMYERYLSDPTSVSDSWREFFADYRSPETPAPAAVSASPGPPPSTASPATQLTAHPATGDPGAPLVSTPAPPSAGPVVVPEATSQAQPAPGREEPSTSDGTDPTVPLLGAAGRIVANMEASLGVPTATSVRVVPSKLLEVNRTIVNNQLVRTTGGKVSFTHLIGYAVVKALGAVPAMNATFVPDADGKGTPGVVHHRHVGLGLAVDVEKADGSRTLLVPCITDADTLDFRGSWLPTRSWCERSTPSGSGLTTSRAPR